jgi:ketosteroid isomerase-like protein
MIAATLLAPVAATAGSSPGEVVDRFFAAYGERSLEGMLATYAADVVFEDVNQRHRFEGTDQVTRLLGSLVAMHYEMGTVEKRRVVQGPTVVVEYDYVGKLNGTVLGQAVGKEGCPDLEYVLPVTSWYEVKDGKITHQRDFIDWATHQELRQRLLAAGAGE